VPLRRPGESAPRCAALSVYRHRVMARAPRRRRGGAGTCGLARPADAPGTASRPALRGGVAAAPEPAVLLDPPMPAPPPTDLRVAGDGWGTVTLDRRATRHRARVDLAATRRVAGGTEAGKSRQRLPQRSARCSILLEARPPCRERARWLRSPS
jgi:hypothetical protein